MKYDSTQKNACPDTAEKKSVKLLMEKMGLSKKELEQISNQYGVSASQLVEVIQFSKYQFIHQGQDPAQCQPCRGNKGPIDPRRFKTKVL